MRLSAMVFYKMRSRDRPSGSRIDRKILIVQELFLGLSWREFRDCGNHWTILLLHGRVIRESTGRSPHAGWVCGHVASLTRSVATPRLLCIASLSRDMTSCIHVLD